MTLDERPYLGLPPGLRLLVSQLPTRKERVAAAAKIRAAMAQAKREADERRGVRQLSATA